jgi:hypothetical protein
VKPYLEFLQLLTLLAGVGKVARDIYIGLKRRRAEPLSKEDTDARTDEPRPILELAIALACAAFLSTLLSDSLVLSGRVAAHGFGTLGLMLLIALTMTGVLAVAWYLRQLEAAISWMGFMTLVIFILSPNGPLNFNMDPSGLPPLSPYAPVFVVTALSASMIFLVYGLPFQASFRESRLSLLLAALLIIIATITLGQALTRSIWNSPTTPQLRSPDALALSKDLRAMTAPKRKQFYRLASELLLAGSRTNQDIDAGASYRRANDGRTLVSQGERDSIAERTMTSAAQRKHLSEEILEGFGRGGSDLPAAASAPTDQVAARQVEYLARRLEWRYPLGRAQDPTVALPLPGATAVERAESNEKYVIVISLHNLSRLERTGLLDNIAYGDQITNEFKADTGKSFWGPRLNRPELFPSRSTSILETAVLGQLALPLNDECALADAEYQILANIWRAQNPVVARWNKQFEELPREQQNAFVEHIIRFGGRFGELAILTALADLYDAGFKGGTPMSVQAVLGGQKELSADSRHNIQALLDRIAPAGASIDDVFQEPVLKLCHELRRSTDKTTVLRSLESGTWVAVQQIASNWADTDDATLRNLIKFRALDSDALRESLLLDVAQGLYQSSDIDFVEPIGYLANRNWVAAAALGSIVMSPLPIVAVLLGALLARRLHERTVIRQTMQSERHEVADAVCPQAVVTELVGRVSDLDQLTKLAARGWGTIAVAARRGVGKTRLLLEIIAQPMHRHEARTIGLWIATPTHVDEIDFIQNVLSRLAHVVESSIESFLRLEPRSVRELKLRWTMSGLYLWLALTILSAVFIVREAAPRAADISILVWTPFAALLLVSAVLVFVSVFSLEPVDPTHWISRKKGISPQTLLLYEETARVRQFLTRWHGRSGSKQSFLWNKIRCVILGISGYGTIYTLTLLPSLFSDFDTSVLSWAAMAPPAVLVSCYLLPRRKTATRKVIPNIMTLVARYREYVGQLIYRLGRGALGGDPREVPRLLICIDELDKADSAEDVSTFLRRAKAIFELPGVFYYLSLAEDALARLYLSAARGRDEIDSSFDHIVRVEPLDWNVSLRLAKSCLLKAGVGEKTARSSTANAQLPTPPADSEANAVPIIDAPAMQSTLGDPSSFPDAIAILSSGIPRDILRRVDEVVAHDFYISGDLNEAKTVIFFNRTRVARVARDVRAFTTSEYELLAGDASKAVRSCQQLLGLTDSEQAPSVAEGDALGRHRTLLLVWIYALAECVGNNPVDWETHCPEIFQIGRDIPTDSVASLITRIAALTRNLKPESRQ